MRTRSVRKHVGRPSNGYPSFCWICSAQLQWMKGGWVSFRIIESRKTAEQHRVHEGCLDSSPQEYSERKDLRARSPESDPASSPGNKCQPQQE